MNAVLKPKFTLSDLSISDIRIDGGTQSRASLNDDVVAEYADALVAGTSMPPVTVFFDGSAHWLADGFHRFHAHRRAERDAIAAEIITGTKRDAVLFSLGANSSHGLPRSNADKRRAVSMLLHDEEWRQWSDRSIATACNVAHSFVASVRLSLDSESGDKKTRTRTKASRRRAERKYVDKHGNESTMALPTQPPPQQEYVAEEPPPELPPLEKAREHAKKQNAVIRALRKDVADRDAQIESLRGDLSEARANAAELADSLDAYMKSGEGDEAVAKELKRLTGQIKVIEATRDQYMTQNAEMKRSLGAKDRRIAKLEAAQS